MRLREQPVTPPAAADPDHLSPYCPRFQYAIELIGRRWVGTIVRMLGGGPARFNEVLAAVPGLSDRLLTERLRELEREGIVTRTVSQDRPVKVTYELTCRGHSLSAVLNEISRWSETWVE